jgi:hypothetical protein
LARHAKTRPLLAKAAFAAGFLLLPAGLIIAPPQFEAAESTTFSTQAAGSTACSSIATGGNEISEINLAGTTYCRHVFTASGSFTVLDPRLTTVDYLIVGGGGGGAARDVGGGGGAGGVVSNLNPGGTNTAGLAVPHNVAVTITVGAGGAGSTTQDGSGTGSKGSASTLGTESAQGGGGGGNYTTRGADGASGGGNGGFAAASTPASLATPAGQGNPGGTQLAENGTRVSNAGGGGGGFGAPGENGSQTRAGNGGVGGDFSGLVGADIGDEGWFAGGGGGAQHRNTYSSSGRLGGDGGKGGGGGQPKNATSSGANGENGMANTGGGAGSATALGGNTPNGRGGNGGSGIVVVRYVLPPEAMAVCDGSSTQNGLTVTAGHGRVFYIDSAPGQDLDAAYLSYTVRSTSARSGLWVQLSDFSGQVVSLAEPSQALHPLEPISANGAQAAFAMVKANRATKVAQSHQVRVYDRKPSSSSVQPLYSCAFSFVEVRETLKAQSNQVLEISADSDIRLGGEVVVTVRGETGLIGKGNNIDGRVVWLSPAARSSWPSASLRLERTEIKFFSDAQRRAGDLLTTHVNTLRVNEATTPPLNASNRQFYTAVYTFRVVGPGANSPIIPVSTVSSGTQMKHADAILAAGIASVDLSAPQVDVTLTKDVNTTTVVNADGTTTVDYELKITNNGTAAVSVDEVIDSPDGVLSYLSGSSELDGTAIADPLVDSAGNLLHSGPITIAAGATRTLSYQMRAVTCAPGGEFKFTNTATARIGSVVVGSSTATKTVVNLLGQCGEAEASKQVEEVALDPEVFTGAANTVTQTSAQLTGSVDSNGEAGLAVRFRLSKDSSLATNPRLISAGTSSNSADATAITAAATGLDPDTTYYYRAEVVVDSNTVIEGEILSFTTAQPPALPEVATEPASFVTASSAALNGLVNPNRVNGGAKVSFEWQPTAAGPTCEANQSALAAGGTSSGFLQSDPADGPPATDEILAGQSEVSVSFELENLTANSEWCYRVVAHHGTGFATRTVGDWVSFTASARTPQTITWDPRGDPLPAGSNSTTTVLATADSGLAVSYSSVDQTICTVDATTGVVTAVATSGNCTITATQDGNASFEPAIPSTLSFAISPPVVATAFLTDGEYQASLNRPLAATGGNGSYGDWQVTAGGLPAGVTLDATTGVLTGTPTEAGSFSFTVTTVSNGVTSAPKTLVLQIAKLPLTVTASNATVEYLAPPPTVTPSYSVFAASDDAQTLITQPTCSSDYQVGTAAGTTATTSCSGGWSDRYTLSYQTGTVTVTGRAITITALPAVKQNQLDADNNIIASPDPEFFFTISPQLAPGEALTDVITQSAVSFTRAAGETDGGYAITPVATAKAGYTLTLVASTLTIQKPLKVPTLSAAPLTVQYGELALGSLSPSALFGGNAVAGAFSYDVVQPGATAGTTVTETLGANTVLPAGSHTVIITFNAEDTTEYVAQLQRTVIVTVTPAPLTISALSAERLIGTIDPALRWQVGPRVGGETVAELGAITISRAAGSTAGSYQITTAGGSHPNYVVSHQPGTFYIFDVAILTTPNNGVVTSRVIELRCDGLQVGSTVTLSARIAGGNPSQLGRTTVASDGSCSFNANLPASVSGQLTTQATFSIMSNGLTQITLIASGTTPLGNPLTISRSIQVQSALSNTSLNPTQPPGTTTTPPNTNADPVDPAQANTGFWTQAQPDGRTIKIYAKNPIGAGKVQFIVDGREIAWVNARTAADPKLRTHRTGPMAGVNYLVRNITLKPGKNRIEIRVDGKRVWRVTYLPRR